MASLAFGVTVFVFDLQRSGEAHIIRIPPGDRSLDPEDPARIAKVHCVTSTAAADELHPMVLAGEAIALVRSGEGRTAHFTVYSVAMSGDAKGDNSAPDDETAGSSTEDQAATQSETSTEQYTPALTSEAVIVGTKEYILSLDVKGKAMKHQHQVSNGTSARE
ncbi:hypothetical protein Gpo141_00013743 [Globisporangium polare]